MAQLAKNTVGKAKKNTGVQHRQGTILVPTCSYLQC